MKTDSHSIDVLRLEYREGGGEAFLRKSLILRCGVCLVCTGGECSLSTGVSEYRLQAGTGMMFVTGTLMQFDGCSEDFRFRMLLFPRKRFMDAALVLDTALFNRFHEQPCYSCGDSDRSLYDGMNLWMDMARLLFPPGAAVVEQEEHNYLQGLFLWLQRSLKINGTDDSLEKSRTVSLCHKFLGLVHEYAAREHDVGFYAGKLCISPRYLNQITVRHVDGLSPKKIIDDQLVAEIKVRLANPALTISQIAGELNFSDQTYMSAFFRRLTGVSPRVFRKSVT